ncbi:hypothetical protein Pdw03_3766 [Penicillium digitatum]|uniref:Uncharacterized protein n=3 Tax=Penicillium digitatum TaxID=36651 RepID=K9G6T5_PEND2|nr:hypothetical protein PDIP_76850 [Penicillium digitatum Pd1]EKV06778.1 hypothetical protein PDIP_76850 [Penicillium digitatum Pd1]EKV08891.1 hypothetical protein PDIG_67550 [Penicillium digitatum PHI26]KAG0159594.1 hypothetical protein PDIDSM_7116 [Penicillium digitatum]QQK40912.1 hypothetical protein Pdw03_3766 [Penicillium digitatum]
MPKATIRSEAAARGTSAQTLNLTDRTAPRRERANSAQSFDSDPTSSSGSSSEDDSESEKEDEQHSNREINGTGESATEAHASDPCSSLPHIAGRPKPRIHRMKGDSELLSRLNAFLPKMKNANEDLQRQIEAGEAEDLVLDNADETGEQYIEMNLGLGVLEERRDGDSASDEETDDEESCDVTGAGKTPQEVNNSDIIGKLMGGKSKKANMDKPSIEEMA